MSTKNNQKVNTSQFIIRLIIIILFLILTYFAGNIKTNNSSNTIFGKTSYSDLIDIPDYTQEVCVMINDNKPYFTEEDYTKGVFESYSELDFLGRCGIAFANVCKEIMPPEGDERGNISSVRPTGWMQAKFDGEYLYNRCHLIAYCLSDEDANEKNLITGTRYFNVQGMLPLEKLVLEYINSNPENHVLYRVTPVYEGKNLLAKGVEMEAYSIEDNGNLSFNVFVYNIQPGANINYSTGELIK